MLAQHVGAGYQPHDHEPAKKNRHGAAAGHAESDRRHEIAAFFGIVCRARSEHAAHVALTESLAIF